MKLFVDTANRDEIRELLDMGLLDGVTTNPTLVAKENHRTGDNPEKIMKDIVEMVPGPVSCEVLSEDSEGMIKEARELRKMGENVTIKIPMTFEGMKAVKVLSSEGIMTNVTLVFSPLQSILAAKAGATFISPFVGRLDDIGHTGMDLVEQIATIYFNYGFDTEIIVASVRHPNHILKAALIGADICTIPYAVIKKMTNHPLTDIGIERFKKDWESIK